MNLLSQRSPRRCRRCPPVGQAARGRHCDRRWRFRQSSPPTARLYRHPASHRQTRRAGGGNNESTEELIDACRNWPSAHVLHGSGITLAGVTFFGLGGGVPVTPFGSWSYDFTEEQAAELLSGCLAGGELVSHSPPQGAVDVSSAVRASVASPCGKRCCASGRSLSCAATSTLAPASRPCWVGRRSSMPGRRVSIGW